MTTPTPVHEEVINKASEIKRPRDRRKVKWGVAGVIFFALLLTIASWLAYSEVKNQAQDATDFAATVADACARGVVPEKFIQVCSDAPKVVQKAPAYIKGDKGDRGPQGPQGPQGQTGEAPSLPQIKLAVSSYCRDVGGCKGKNGKSVTVGQVISAVATYCDARGECRGPTGNSGPRGETGDAGPQGQQGPTGPPPTDQQVLDAVKNYCGNNNCKGEKGDPGDPGTTITGFSCTPTDSGVEIKLDFSNADSRTLRLEFSNKVLGNIECSEEAP